VIGAIVLGIFAGYVGRLLLPGKDPLGCLGTFAVGLAGSVVGYLIFTELFGIGDTEIFDLGGLPGAIIGVMIVLLLIRRFGRREPAPPPPA